MIVEERAKDLDLLRRQRDTTGNPLYVWEAVRQCHHPNYPAPYPDWVREYLNDVAINFQVMGRLLDPRTFPERQEGESAEDHLKRYHRWDNAPPIAIASTQALTLQCLGFVRKGWNAFKSFYADARDRSDALDIEFPLDKSRREVWDEKAARDGDERIVRRRVKRGRELLERPSGRRKG